MAGFGICSPRGAPNAGRSENSAEGSPSGLHVVHVMFLSFSLPSASFRLPPGSELVQLNVDTHAQCVSIHTMKSREIISALQGDGWVQVAQKGSHVQFKHPTKKGRVTVPHPERDIPVGTLKSIEKQSGLKLR
jgi:predicted RNA binding protein YcfA (HicA-like mRNA interferase family)